MSVALSAAQFPLTRWSVVLKLQKGTTDAIGQKALAELCSMYWSPLYAFAVRCGQSPHDAEDLTQGFFARLIERDLFAKADPARGKLRSFLLGAFKNFMSEERRHAHRQKRGNGESAIPIHELQLEDLECGEAGWYPAWDPEAAFDRVWFDVLLEHSLNHLEQEYRRRGKGEMFRKLQDFLAWNRKDARLGDVARELEMSHGALRVTVLRMRQRFREIIEQQIAETVAGPAEAAEELAHLRCVLGG